MVAPLPCCTTPLSGGVRRLNARGSAGRMHVRSGFRSAALRGACLALAGLGVGAGAGLHAQEKEADRADPQAAGTTITVTASRPTPSCTRPPANGGGPPIDYACLTRSLKAEARSAPGGTSAIDAAAAQAHVPSRVGTFSFSATAQRMGSNFGKAAMPYRPPPPVYANPIIAGQPPR